MNNRKSLGNNQEPIIYLIQKSDPLIIWVILIQVWKTLLILQLLDDFAANLVYVFTQIKITVLLLP